MMGRTVIPRKLWYYDDDLRREVGQEFLTDDTHSKVVLGEAGMGKTTLLNGLGRVHGHAFCTARKLVNHPRPAALLGSATTLVVDALDEVAAGREGGAVDLVVRRLGDLGHPRFILSCRVADWQSATGIAALSDFYDPPPLQLHLGGLGRLDALVFLSATLGAARADEVVAFLEDRNLEDLWVNPQTLTMLGDVAARGPLPTSKGELFDAAVRVMRAEHREAKNTTASNRMADDEVLDAAGAAFAALVLTGREAVSRLATPEDGDLPSRELRTLPGAGGLEDVLDARLFSAAGSERFRYAHRAIGEFLGARWLVRHVSTQRKRRRLFALFHNRELVPISLRGLHAWLAWHARDDADLGVEIVDADPMGVVEYGDADDLGPRQATALFHGLDRLSRQNPAFRRWRDYRVGGLARRELLPDIRSTLLDRQADLAFRYTVIQALGGSALVVELLEELRAILMDTEAAFALRSEVGKILVRSKAAADWPEVVSAVLAEGGENGPQLAMELLCEVGLDTFDDGQILAVVFGQLGRLVTHVWVYRRLEEVLPLGRVDALLDGLADVRATAAETDDSVKLAELGGFVFELVTRRLLAGTVEPGRFWSWIVRFQDSSAIRYPSWDGVADLLRATPEFRHAVQRHVLLDGPGEHGFHYRKHQLSTFKGLSTTEDDYIHLLAGLDDHDPRWRDVVGSAWHSPTSGAAVRHAAVRFVTDEETRRWLVNLAEPHVPDWDLEQRERVRQEEVARQARWSMHREEFGRYLERLRDGNPDSLIAPAKAYVRLFRDIRNEGADGPTRLKSWLGAEIRDACLAGFEAYLTATSPEPTATDIAESRAIGRYWEVAHALMAALFERQRVGRGFDDLSDERLLAGLVEFWSRMYEDVERSPDLEQALVDELRRRGAWERLLRLAVEPRLERGTDSADRLSELTRGDTEPALVASLAEEWLRSYPDMPREPEMELADCLLHLGRHETLASLASIRRLRENDDRRRDWEAVGLVVDFEATSAALDTRGVVEPELLWQCRARTEERSGSRSRAHLEAGQLAWLVERFRPLFPAVARPQTTYGSDHPWDATEYIRGLAVRLGEDASDRAVGFLARLATAPCDGYSGHLKAIAAEQKRKKVEETYQPPSLETVRSALVDLPPTTTAQLQAVVLEELEVVQRKLRGSDLDWYRDFLDGRRPKGEEACRDTLLKMMDDMPFGIQALPEGHLADDKRCDIACLLSGMLVPVELKGQWHPDLWTAADRQLDRLYVNDHRADRGIYLILWFGKSPGKNLTKPPTGTPVPNTPEELLAALAASSEAARRDRVEVVVLNLVRPG